MTFEEKFWSRIIKQEDGCWIFSGSTTKPPPFGYGQLYQGNKHILAHRYSYQLHNGETPTGMYVLHKCDNRLCCNPAHLFLGTLKDNTQDAIKKNRTASGERHGKCKLTKEQAKEIWDARNSKNKYQLAHKFGVKYGAVRDIFNGNNWKEVHGQ